MSPDEEAKRHSCKLSDGEKLEVKYSWAVHGGTDLEDMTFKNPATRKLVGGHLISQVPRLDDEKYPVWAKAVGEWLIDGVGFGLSGSSLGRQIRTKGLKGNADAKDAISGISSDDPTESARNRIYPLRRIARSCFRRQCFRKHTGTRYTGSDDPASTRVTSLSSSPFAGPPLGRRQ